MKHSGKIAKKSLLLLAVAGLLISPLFTILQSLPVLAVNNNYAAMTATGRMKFQDGLKVLQFCENNGARLMIPSGHGTAVDSEWKMYSNDLWTQSQVKQELPLANITLPAYYTGSSSSVDCGKLFTRYGGLFGITDAEAFLNDAGFTGWVNGQRTHGGGCNNTRATEAACLKSAILKRVDNYRSDWDPQMNYVRDKTILDAQVGGSDPGGCFAHWTSQTTPGSLDIAEWVDRWGRDDDGILGTIDTPQVIKLVGNPPTEQLVDYFVMAEGGDGNDGWQKEVKTTIETDGNNLTDGTVVRCQDLAYRLSNNVSQDYRAWAAIEPDNVTETGTGGANGTADDTPESATTCQIEGIGWVICPVMKFMAMIVDEAYGVVALLLTTPNIDMGTTSGTYRAWEAMRTIANIAFVIVFLIIIFSQLTSVGITNYGVKKMLPRIIVAAILVNVSYFLCAVAVDISNILGSSIKQIFDSVGGQLATPALQDDPGQNGAGWEPIVGVLLAGGVIAGVAAVTLYAGLSVLLPALIAALAAIVTVFLVLTLRQALIIILVVIAPLAFVAYLLPNTESLFTKWRKLLTTLLLMYPIIAGIFGASALASTVIMASSDEFAVKVMGALVAIIPLFITPIVMKSAGGVLNRFGGMINNPNKGPFDRMRKGAEGYRKNRQEFRNLKAMNGVRSLPGMGMAAKRRAGREAILNNRKGELNRANADYISDKSATDEAFMAKMAQGGGEGATDRAAARSVTIREKLDDEEVENQIKLIISKGNPETMQADMKTALKKAVAEGDHTGARAAQKILATQLGAPGVGALNDVMSDLDASGNADQETMTHLRKDINSLGLKGKDNILATRGYKGETMQDIAKNPDTYSGLNPVELANQSIATLKKGMLANEVRTRTNAQGEQETYTAVGITGAQARATLSNPSSAALITGEKRALFTEISNADPGP